MGQIIVIAGPTGSGKTQLAVEIARLINGEIISADSRQVYKYLDTGTNKEGVWDRARKVRVADGINQHLTDIIEPDRFFSAGDFTDRALAAVKEIRARGKKPVIAGGTGLYIKALIDGLAKLPERDPAIRAELEEQISKKGVEDLYESLKKVDPESAEKNTGNPQRLIRAMEVYRITGVPISVLHKNTKPTPEQFLQFALDWGRDELYAIINARSAGMFKEGMIEETKKALSMGFPKDCPGLQGLGYRRIVEYIDGIISKHEALKSLAQDNRNYAKRQLTWFKKDERIRWFRVSLKQFDTNIIANTIADLIE